METKDSGPKRPEGARRGGHKLSDSMLRELKPSGKHKAGDKISDGDGLYLLVTESGKYWRMAYRFGGKQRTLAIGIYPAVGLAAARKKCREAHAALADGKDPMEAKRDIKAAERAATNNTVAQVAADWLATKKSGWSATHYHREARNLEKDILPHLGRRVIGDIEPPELLKVLRRIEARGAVYVAHRVLMTARGVWQHAVAYGYADRDITQDLGAAVKPHTKKNYPALVKPAEVRELLRASAAYTGGPIVRAALMIAPILFQRPGNLRHMRWRDLDLDAGLWTIPSADMKRRKGAKLNGAPHIVPLPRQAVAILQGLQPLTGHGEYVFTGFRDPARAMSEAAVNAALHGMGYAGRHTWHGYRATGRTLLREELHYEPDVIEAQLAHTGQISHGGAYDRARFVKERAVMLQKWADYLDRLRLGADVVPIKAKTRA